MPETLNITPEERQEIATLATPMITAARACIVKSQRDYSDAAMQLTVIKTAQKKLAEKKRAIVDPINQALKAARALFAAPERELDEAEGFYKRAMISYSDEQERIRREEQARLEREAAAERAKKEEQARKAREAAEAAAAAGDHKKAERLEAKAEKAAELAASTIAPQVQTQAPRASGIAQAEYWSAVVVDFPALVRAVADGVVPITALQANMTLLNQQARSLKRELRWPGVSPVRETGIRAGSR